MSKNDALTEAKQVLEIEAKCILATRDRLNGSFTEAIDTLHNAIKSEGKIVVSGVGKSGKVAAKVAATLTSMGSPALFLHATEASHGDFGVVSSKDVALLFSYSGSSEEILHLIPSFKKRGTRIISIVGNIKSLVAQNSDIVIDGSVEREACPLNLAPTSSTTVAMALGDAIAMTLSTRLGFKEEEFASNHPGGSLGRRLNLQVKDLMYKADKAAWINSEALMDDVVRISTEKKLGGVLVRKQSKWIGLITDGDIRRALAHKNRFFELTAEEVMTKNPVTVSEDAKALQALQLMEDRPSQISILPVTNSKGECVGLIRLHDLVGRL